MWYTWYFRHLKRNPGAHHFRGINTKSHNRNYFSSKILAILVVTLAVAHLEEQFRSHTRTKRRNVGENERKKGNNERSMCVCVRDAQLATLIGTN